MHSLSKQIDQAIDQAMAHLSRAVDRRDFAVIEATTARTGELRRLKQQLSAIENRFQHLVEGNASSAAAPIRPTIREVAVEVTQGMINQNLLTMTDVVKKGLIQPGEKMVIEVCPSGETFETELLANGNKLRERGKIGRFYRSVGIQAGDTIILREVTPGRWELRKSEFVRYQNRG